MRFLAATILALAATATYSGKASAETGCTEITSLPANITQPGKYCLAVDHVANITTGSLINIGANHVTLDCQNHTLRNNAISPTGNSSAIVAFGRQNVLIENCRVVGGFTYGINVSQNNSLPNQSIYNTIRNNVVAGPYSRGIVALGSAIEVHGNRVYDIGGQSGSTAMGIQIAGSDVGYKFQIVRENLVAGTNSPDSTAFGIFSNNSIASLINHNMVTGTSSAEGQTSYAVRIAQGVANTISDNVLKDDGSSQTVGVLTAGPADYCHSNEIWATQATRNCTAFDNW